MEIGKAFISVGHYPRRSGAVNTKYGLAEHHEAGKIANALFTKILTPQTIYSYIPVKSQPLKEKASFINSEANHESIVLEINFNACKPNQAQGIETLYFPGSKQGKILASQIQETLFNVLPFTNHGL